MALSKEQKAQLISKYQLHESDTGSPEVQVSILTNRINYLTAETSGLLKRQRF